MKFPVGYYSRGFWQIRPFFEDSTGLWPVVTASHEEAHYQLNISSIYGFFIEIYAKLSIEALQDKEKFADIVGLLVERSRDAHEVFATWMSVKQFAYGRDEKYAAALLNNDPVYLEYYKKGEKLSQNMPGFYLKLVLVQIIFNFCFQGQRIGEAVLRDLRALEASQFRSLDFPTARLQRILKDIEPTIYLTWLETFMADRTESAAVDYFRRDMLGEKMGEPNLIAGIQELTEELSMFCYAHLQHNFDNLGSPSYPIDALNAVVSSGILEKICDITGEELEDMGIYLDTENNSDRLAMIRYETEKTIINDPQVKCRIYHYPDIPDRLKNYRVPSDDTLLLVGRHSLAVREQFDFVGTPDKEWINSHHNSLVYIPVAGEVLELVCFESPEDALAYYAHLFEINGRFSTAGCIALSVLTLPGWAEVWEEFFSKVCRHLCLLNDISLLYLAETYFLQPSEVTTYVFAELKCRDSFIPCLIADIKIDKQKSILMLTFGGAAYLQLMVRYITMYIPALTEDSRLGTVHETLANLIADKIFLTEHIWYFRTQGLPKNYYRSNNN